MEFENEDIIYKNVDGFEFIQFKKLLDFGVQNAYTLRGENIDFSFKRETTANSYKKLCKALDIEDEKLLVPRQSHTDTIKCVNKVLTEDELTDVDALITDKKGFALATRNADCILFFFYDPIKKVVANVHSGWKGTFKKIAQKTVMKMITNYECKPEDIWCFISPSIRKCHFEVDEDVKDLCQEIFNFKPTNSLSYERIGEDKTIAEVVTSKGEVIDENQKYNIDTVLINKIILEDLGIKPENIIDSNICSVCHQDRINSARVQGKEYQRAIAVAMLK